MPLSNIERFLSLSTPTFSPDYNMKTVTLSELFNVFNEPSNFGLKLYLTVPR